MRASNRLMSIFQSAPRDERGKAAELGYAWEHRASIGTNGASLHLQALHVVASPLFDGPRNSVQRGSAGYIPND